MDNTSFQAFAESLTREGKSPLTVRSYLSDLAHFATWFAQANGEVFTPGGITLLDVRGYKSHLLTVAQFKPATVNRRLAALARFCAWAKGQGLLAEDPTGEVKGVRRAQAAPKALNAVDLRRLLREVHKRGKKRDVAIVELLSNTGLRVGELSQLTLGVLSCRHARGWSRCAQAKGPSTARCRSMWTRDGRWKSTCRRGLLQKGSACSSDRGAMD